MEKTVTFEAANACPIILNSGLTNGYSNEPARRHKKKRIQKKWLKRYGCKQLIDGNIYIVQEPPRPIECCQTIPEEGRKAIMMHPVTFRKFVKAFGSEPAAAAGIYKYFTEVTGTLRR